MSSEDFIIRQYRNRIRKRVLSTMLVGLILSVLVFLDIRVGSSSIAFKDLVDAVLKGPAGGSSASFIVWEIRLPMTFTCLFVGASLSLAGLLIQTITNNPLASPYLGRDGRSKFRSGHCHYDRLCTIRTNLARCFAGCTCHGADGIGIHFLSRK